MENLIFFILMIALIFRVALLIVKRQEPILSDAQDYHSLALHLLKGKFYVPGTKLDEFRTPGYPLFISLIYRISRNQEAVFMIQMLINLGSIYLAYLIGCLMFNEMTGIIAALILCIDPDFVYYVYDILTETLFSFFLLLSIYLILLYDTSGSLLYPILTGLTLSIMIYIKPGAFFLPVIYLLIIPWQTGIYLLGFYLAPLIPWMLRNYIKYGQFRMCSIKGYNLLVFNLGEQKGNDTLNNYIKATKFCRVAHGFANSRYNSSLVRQAIMDQPIQFLLRQIRGMFIMMTQLTLQMFGARFVSYDPGKQFPLTVSPWNFVSILKSTQVIQLVYLLVIYMAAIAGIWQGGFNKQNILIAGIIAYFVLLPGGAGQARYRVPIMPLIILMAVNFIIK
jgi:hypothetical protein